jgi:hypothetical protein
MSFAYILLEIILFKTNSEGRNTREWYFDFSMSFQIKDLPLNGSLKKLVDIDKK